MSVCNLKLTDFYEIHMKGYGAHIKKTIYKNVVRLFILTGLSLAYR